MFKAIIAIIIFYVLVKVISGLFLQSPGKKKGNFGFFYQTFKNVREQQKKRQEQQQNRTKDGKNKVDNRLDDIEEAEYEDITEENKKTEQ
jgi:hypothetical protein